MTPNEITTLIATNLRKELDVPFKKQLMERVKYWRSSILRQTLDKDPQERKYFRQRVILNIKRGNKYPCDTGLTCYTGMTEDAVPVPVRANNILFDYVGGLDGNSPFRQCDPGTMRFMLKGKYSKHITMYEYFLGQPMEISNPELQRVLIEGIFDDPEEITTITCDEGGNKGVCDFWDTEYPMSADVTRLVVQSILTVDYRQPQTPENKEIPVNGAQQ